MDIPANSLWQMFSGQNETLFDGMFNKDRMQARRVTLIT